MTLRHQIIVIRVLISELYCDINVNGGTGDRRITRREYVDYTRQHEPELVNWSDTLFNIYDWDGDSILDLHDYVHFYMEMDYEGKQTPIGRFVVERVFAGCVMKGRYLVDVRRWRLSLVSVW